MKMSLTQKINSKSFNLQSGHSLRFRLFKTAFLLLFVVVIVWGISSCKKNEEAVELTFTSWRIDDVDAMNRINALFTATHPNISVNFSAEDPILYDAATNGKLANGTASDIIFLWSYDKGRLLYDSGYLTDLTKIIPNLSSFPIVPLNAWSTPSGVTYGVPSVGVTHGIYYNKAIFSKYQIQEPATWTEFIAACDKLLQAGETVIAQGAADNSWILNRVIFCGLGANFYGGETARQGLMNGTMKLTDSNFLDAFVAVNSLVKYMPAGYKTLGYEASKVLFASGKAAMFIGGSWEISVLQKLGASSSTIGWFAPPVKKAGDKLQYCFQLDAGIGINKNSKHSAEAIEYIKWASGSEYATAVMTELPGFFSYTPGTSTLSNPLAQKMFNTAATATLTIRLMDEKFNSKSPTGDALMNDALQGMLLGNYTPQSAAAYVQDRLK
ncbi:MAG: ABC transporter substrate-binding protein [Prolixibacteraceae bacterium]